jgi:hypothetical protein
VIAAAKRHNPRGYRNQYITGWDHQCDELYERFNSDHEKESAVALLEQLNEQKNREDIVEKTNNTHSSRKAWNLLKKLGTDSHKYFHTENKTLLKSSNRHFLDQF